MAAEAVDAARAARAAFSGRDYAEAVHDLSQALIAGGLDEPSLEWIMLQASVHAEVRGRALGGWNFAIGWGWLGPLSLGALADATSVPTALTVSGTLLVVFAAVAFAASATLRAR